MKKIIFLVTIISLFMMCSNVNASSNEFYHAERIEGVFTKTVGPITKYQTARFFRRVSDNKALYCLEPYIVFSDTSSYSSQITRPESIDEETWKKISLIAYYGYGYGDHWDQKWYAVSQVLIWREIDKSSQFFFTDVLDGNRIERFTEEINEINNLVNNYYKEPSFKNKTINIKKGTKYIYDDNNVLSNYKSLDSLSIKDNKIDISDLDVGNYTFGFEKNISDEIEPTTFYYSEDSQNFLLRGNIDKDKFSVNINIYDTEIKIEKKDVDTKSSNSCGDGNLCGAKFGLYNEKQELIEQVTLNDNCEAIIKNLDLGKYYIKELEPGVGYVLNDTLYSVDLSLEQLKNIVIVENKIIEKEVNIHKDYGDDNSKLPEEHVIFDIYSHDNYITSITTDLNGNAKVVLPYGEYVFKQITTKEGYKKADDLNVSINDVDTNLDYKLMDYVVNVPDTRSDSNNNYFFINFILLISIEYVKKILFI